MTASGHSQATPVNLPAEGEVVAFLRSNPTFLDAHPELLRQMSIPHASGDAVSLLERQVAVLREDNVKLRRQFEELVGHARRNESLNGRIHALVLKLMGAAGPQAIFNLLESCLRDDFGADRVASRIFADPAFVDGADVPQFVGSAATLRTLFVTTLDQAEAICGPLAAGQHAALFEDETPAGSAVSMPLQGSNWDGVLVISSDDPDRFEAGMGTEILTYLRDVVTLVIEPWVKRGRPG
ncbi:MAG: DUF484 family protein [Gammaproteobacteria bacterium]